VSDRFERALNKTLKAGAARIDQRTRDDLARRRRDALDLAENTRSRTWLWMPGGAVAAAIVAALLAQPYVGKQTLPLVEADTADVDMELLLAEDSLELYEDLEFYEWLDVAGDAG